MLNLEARERHIMQKAGKESEMSALVFNNITRGKYYSVQERLLKSERQSLHCQLLC